MDHSSLRSACLNLSCVDEEADAEEHVQCHPRDLRSEWKSWATSLFFSALNNEQQSWRNNSLFFDCQTSKSDTLWVRSFIYTFISTLYRPPIV